MYHPTTRVLTVLELLQAHHELTGPEIARRLEVDVRTVRRYITMLQDMGIPVEAERGRYGSYRLRPGFKLPPLMFTPDEALALVLSLQVARQSILSGIPAAHEGALAKIERVLPAVLHEQVQAIQAAMVIDLTLPEGQSASMQVLASLGTAIRDHRRVFLRHESREGEVTERPFDPFGLVYRAGRWYASGYCHLRHEIRTFRLDRVASVTLLDEIFQQPTDFDAVEQVEKALAATPGLYRVEVLFAATLEQVQAQIPRPLGELQTTADGVLLVCYVQRLAWIAGFLAGLTLPMQICVPPELHDEMRLLIERVQHSIG
jgi:predicted DNA-binding transcriptional regulator YafY